MLLQIPVRHSHHGGELKVIHQEQRSQSFKTSHHNPGAFSLTVFSSDCQLIRKPIIHGSLVEVVFHLRLKSRPPALQQDEDPLYRIWQNPAPSPPDEALARVTRKQAAFANLFNVWKNLAHSKIELFAIPLDHQYSKKNLSFRSLKGIDRLLVDVIQSLLGGFVELHLAVVHKYIGYDDDDWTTFGRLRTNAYSGHADVDHMPERDWTEFLASNFVDQNDRRLKLPPLAITVPDELIGNEGQVFHPPLQSNPDRFEGGDYDGQIFHRPALIMWPRNQSLTVALCFGLDSGLDVVEQGSAPESPCHPHQSVEIQVRMMLAYTYKAPLKSWFAHTLPWTCSDQRCFAAQPIPLAVAHQRVERLVSLCLRWNLHSAGLELLKVIGNNFNNVEFDDFYFCSSCSASSKPGRVVFVGGVHSNSVAASLAKLIDMLGWTAPVEALVTRLLAHHAEQVGPLCHLALSLHRLGNHIAARFVFNQMWKLMNQVDMDFNEILKGIPSCIEAAFVIDRKYLSEYLCSLRDLGDEYTPHIVASFRSVDLKLIKDLPEVRELYISLCWKLEAHVRDPMPPWTWIYQSASMMDDFGWTASQLMSSILWLQDAELLRSFFERIAQPTPPGKRNIIPALLATRNTWASPSGPLVESLVQALISVRILQLSRFRKASSKMCWEQPDAVLDGFPQVEEFLRSNEKTRTFDGFATEEEAKDLTDSLTLHAEPNSGYNVQVVKTVGRGGKISVKVTKTDIIFQSIQRELAALTAESKGLLMDREKETADLAGTAKTTAVVGSRVAPALKRKRFESSKKSVPRKRSKQIIG